MRTRRARRRKLTARHNKRLLSIARYTCQVGPYFDEDKGIVINPGRGTRSKFLKRLGHKKARKAEAYGRSGYNRCFDFWWAYD